LLTAHANAVEVWSGLTKSFSKTGSDDETLPQFQDRLTDNVILTRGFFGGLINIATEFQYSHGFSPEDTEWATDLTTEETIAATNWEDLESANAFTSWIDAFGGMGSGGEYIADRDAVVHLITDDIYLDLQFTSWLQGPTSGNDSSYSYLRAEPPAPPTTGDYNENGVVDAADYVDWRKTLGQPATPAGSGADGDADGTIDQDDYTFWAARFGNTVPGSGGGAVSTAVPEPASLVLLTTGLLAVPRRVR
jgi:hypothetical protein